MSVLPIVFVVFLYYNVINVTAAVHGQRGKKGKNMSENDKKLQEAIKLLNDNQYIVLPVTNGQICLCDMCRESEAGCRYGAFGYTCSNLICLNGIIKEQLDYKGIIANLNAG